jgi:murein DD-endopeptidase MepM/ murein hydrolase activator NlpD
MLGLGMTMTGCGLPLNNNELGSSKGSNLPSGAVVLQISSADFPIDETQATRSGPGPWNRSERCGTQGGMYWVSVNNNTIKNSMTWRAQLQQGRYAVLAFIPGCNATTRNARYKIRHAGGETVVTVNQYEFSQVWRLLGIYNFGPEGSVILADDTGEAASTGRKVGFDAIAWVPVADRFGAPLASTLITQPFGDGHCNNSGSYGHLGEDLSASLGTAVLATANGIVTQVGTGWNNGWGNAYVVMHVLPDQSLRYSVYAHLNPINNTTDAKLHQIVRIGQRIGNSGNSGNSTNPHLHFGIKDRDGFGAAYTGSNFAGDSFTHNGVTYYMPSRIAGYRVNPPNAPTNLTATAVSSSQIDLTWSHDGRNVQSFQIERSSDGRTWNRIITCHLRSNARSYQDKGLAPGTTYHYRVRAYDAYDTKNGTMGNASGYSNVASATTRR